MNSVHRFFQAMKLEPTPRTSETVGVRINERQVRKKELKIETSEEYCRERIRIYLDRCREQHLPLPALPQFKG